MCVREKGCSPSLGTAPLPIIKMPPLAPYQEALVVGHVDNGAVRRGQVLPALNLHGGDGGRDGTRVRSGAQVWGGGWREGYTPVVGGREGMWKGREGARLRGRGGPEGEGHSAPPRSDGQQAQR